MSDCEKINYKKRMLDFIREFDDEANGILDQKRKQFELEENTLEYVRLERIKEDMLASCVQILPKLNNKNNKSDFNETSEEFMSYINSALCFVKEVSDVEWLTRKYFLAYEGFLRECGMHVFESEINRLYDGIACFFRCVRYYLVQEGLMKIDAWNSDKNPFLPKKGRK